MAKRECERRARGAQSATLQHGKMLHGGVGRMVTTTRRDWKSSLPSTFAGSSCQRTSNLYCDQLSCVLFSSMATCSARLRPMPVSSAIVVPFESSAAPRMPTTSMVADLLDTA